MLKDLGPLQRVCNLTMKCSKKFHCFVLGLIDLSYPPLLATIFVFDKAESTPCSLPT